ncbi:MAG: 23S rRNA (uracil(1939)-C(5))-methyltransferase RlmD [Deltaproteobacteria bacterium]|nr:23S rRNA (uracil(1939)-C(5))-methyltransferase RlmD [Deltaproteobacteria bacterium]
MGKYVPPCTHYPNCVGCPWIHRPYPEQLERKRQRLTEALAVYPNLMNLEIPEVEPSPRRLGYRARIKLVVGKAKREILTGLYYPRSHRVVDISSCAVHPKQVNSVLKYLKRQIIALEIEPYNEKNDSGDLRYIDLRYSFSRRKVSVTLVTRHARFDRGEELARALNRRFSFVSGVIQNINETRGNVIWGERFRTLAGRDSVEEKIGFLKLKLPAGVFSQANPWVAEKIYRTTVALGELTGHETGLDLYCGVGPLSLFMATHCDIVWGIDENPLSISAAKQNAKINGIHNCRFFAGNVAGAIRQARDRLPKIDLILCNPPRKGLQPDALDAILAANPFRILYVACDPTTLARDLHRLAGHGYRVTSLRPFDMFPQTEEVETVVRLDKS